ncbi:hypothetical protein CKO28_14865 [Rhodovibrio sodomensis]|uniref:DUF1127 domain-containing protein n=1 Tax=Rhodovibrio sodomensis TaxID=1088 RepID=A0ABS1DGU0_9PROT|nr:hypothetical protein [Rhodovibrio sodomensis]MBK1669317.1 hypothetical protein [Rhodovibrio sodomensis]
MSRRELTFTVSIPVLNAGDLKAGLLRLPGRLWHVLLIYQERASARAALRTMEPRMRRDMGIRYEDCLREAYKPFWRP